MTREEAIITLKVVDENATCDDCLYYNSMEDCPNDEDCIIRQAFNMAIKALEQEPKTGHWILDDTDNSITCDKCGCLIWANDISNGDAYYCPNCGAKMAESEE